MPERQEILTIFTRRMENVRAAMGEEQTEKVSDAFEEYNIMESRLFSATVTA